MQNEVLKLGLSRGDFNNHSVETFHNLFKSQNFTDVTLVCEDQRQIKSHKVILSAGSQFFNEILLRNPHPNPLIFIKVKYDYLHSLVRFIYTGECEVEQHDIEAFLVTAKDLKIEGLASETETNSTVPNQNNWEKEATDPRDCATQPNEEKCSKTLTSDLDVATIKTEIFEYDKLDKKDLQNTFICNECDIVVYCEASLRVHKRKKHNIKALNIKEQDMSPSTQNDIISRTLKERIRELNKFEGYVSSRSGKSLAEILASKGGNEVVSNMVFSYLSNFRIKDGKIPKFSSLSIIRSSIKRQLIEAHLLDISNKEHFPEFKARWFEIIGDLYADGMACKECGKQFEDMSSLNTHLENHSGGGLRSCTICGTEFSRKWRLEKHMLTHVESKLEEN